jgi:hypothetical protein
MGVKLGSLTVSDLRRLRAFENRALRRIFGPKWDEVRREWITVHNGELNDLYSSLSIVRVIKLKRIRWVEHVARMRERSGVYMVLVGELEGKRPLGRPGRKWDDNIMMDLQEVWLGVWT